MCSIPASIECDYHYFVAVNSSGSIIYVVQPKKCLLLPVWAMVTIILVGLVIIGIVILTLAKLIIMYHDYREVQDFNKELKGTTVVKKSNPMYQPPTVTYKNVTYDGEVSEDSIDEDFI